MVFVDRFIHSAYCRTRPFQIRHIDPQDKRSQLHFATTTNINEYPSSKQIEFQLMRLVFALCIKATSRCSRRHQKLVVYRYVYDIKVYHLPLPADRSRSCKLYLHLLFALSF